MLMHKETPQISADYALDEGLNRFGKKKKNSVFMGTPEKRPGQSLIQTRPR